MKIWTYQNKRVYDVTQTDQKNVIHHLSQVL